METFHLASSVRQNPAGADNAGHDPIAVYGRLALAVYLLAG